MTEKRFCEECEHLYKTNQFVIINDEYYCIGCEDGVKYICGLMREGRDNDD